MAVTGLLLVLCWLLAFTSAVALDTHQTVPSATSTTFNTTNQTFLQNEDANRLADWIGPGFVVANCLGSTSGTKVMGAFACTAYTDTGFYINQSSAAIDFGASPGPACANDDVAWVIATKDTTAAPGGNFVRVSGTRYAVDCTSTTQPSTPTDATVLFQATIASGALTALVDMRALGPLLPQGDNSHGLTTLDAEQRAWWSDAWTGYVSSGCAPSVPSSSLTFDAFACTAYLDVSGAMHYVTQPARAVTVPNSATVWLAIHQDLTSTPSGCSGGNWSRVSGTHYLTCASTTDPGDPTAGMRVAEVTVASSVITVVRDLRVLAPTLPDRHNTHGSTSVIAEQRAWWGDATTGWIESGCVGVSNGGGPLTINIASCTAYVLNTGSPQQLEYVQDDALRIVNFSSGDGTYWVIVHASLSATVSGWTRSPASSHYLWQKSTTQPALPSRATWSMRVLVSGGAVTGIGRLGASAPFPLTQANAVFDVRQYGAVPNDGNDDTAAFIQAVAAADAVAGSILLVTGGTYDVGTIDCRSCTDLTFRGVGWPTLKRLSNSAFEPNPGNILIFWLDDASRITIEGFQFDANGKEEFGGINGNNIDTLYIRHNRYFDSNSPGAWTGDPYFIGIGIGSSTSTRVYVQDNVVNLGVIEVDRCQYCYIERNTSTNAPTNGIVWASLASTNVARDYYIRGNTVENAGGVAIGINFDSAASGVTVSRVWVTDNTVHFSNTSADNRYGIVVGHATLSETDNGSLWEDIHVERNSVIWDTTATEGGTHALIQVGISGNGTATMKDVVIANNIVNGGFSSGASRKAAKGILSQEVDGLVVSGNVVRNMQQGIWVLPKANSLPTISGNTLTALGQEGIIVYGNSTFEGAVVQGNTIRTASQDGASTYAAIRLQTQASDSTLLGNIIDCSDCLVAILESDGDSENNLAIGNRIIAPAARITRRHPWTTTTAAGTGANTTATDLQSLSLRKTLLGNTGGILIEAMGTVTGTNDAKSVRLFFGTAELAEIPYLAGETDDWYFSALVQNDAAQNAQQIVVQAWRGATLEVHDVLTTTQDTSASVVVKTQATTTNASDEVTSEMLRFRPTNDF